MTESLITIPLSPACAYAFEKLQTKENLKKDIFHTLIQLDLGNT